MSDPVHFTVEATDGAARAGVLHTPHGAVRTPAFMPVGTRGTVRAVDSADLRRAGTEIVLANTYHLMLRPGAEVVERLGGLHRFMAWDGPLLTDSGGYQVFSLDPSIDEEGATFRSSYDGSAVRLTPEEAVRVQERLGPDVAMVLDVCIGLPAPQEEVIAAMERTLRWSERALRVHRRSNQALFGIVQGGTDPELRARSARATAALGFPGFGIGGLSVGESAEERNRAMEAAMAELPADGVRYVMGLGDAAGMLEAVRRGADLFDCVWPTRLARHGKVLSARGDFNIRRAEFAASEEPLQADCPCPTCASYSRAYVRHLVVTDELLAHRLITVHNLTFTLSSVAEMRAAIAAGGLGELRPAEGRGQVSGDDPGALR